MRYQAKRATGFFAAPNGNKLANIMRNEIVLGTGNKAPGFIEVKRDDDSVGWGAEADFTPLDAGAQFDLGGFVIATVNAAGSLNAVASIDPWLVPADFLLARASVETGIKESGAL